MSDPDVQRLSELMEEADIWEEPASAQVATPELPKSVCADDTNSTKSLPSSSDATLSSTPLLLERGEHVQDKLDPDTDVAPTQHELVIPRAQKKVLNNYAMSPGHMPSASPAHVFCPWRLVRHYTDFFGGHGKAPLIRPYFKLERLLTHSWHFRWHFFYLYNTADNSGTPILLVPSWELDRYLYHIGQELHVNLDIPATAERDGYKYRFNFMIPDGTACSIRPRYLGQARDHEDFIDLTAGPLPLYKEDDARKLAGMEHRFFQDLWKLMKETARPNTGKERKKEKKRLMRAAMHKGWGHTTKRVQRYMGLRENILDAKEFPEEGKERLVLTELDVESPPPFWLDECVVFISFDCEMYEMNHSLVTEVGFGILDTKDLSDVPPGVDGRNWFNKITARHLRITEHSDKVNMKWVKGCPDNFNFGESEWVAQADMYDTLEDIFKGMNPFSKYQRAAVVVGHDVQHDIDHLAQFGFSVEEKRNVMEIVDNQGLHQFMRKLQNGQSLEGVLVDFDIPYKYLHNAGNDAVYTLQSMIVLAIRQRQASLERNFGTTELNEDPVDAPDQDEGWSSGGEGCDGGSPPPLPRRGIESKRTSVSVDKPSKADVLHIPEHRMHNDFSPTLFNDEADEAGETKDETSAASHEADKANDMASAASGKEGQRKGF